ncbi:MAG: radical SAM protein [Treponema sp.]|nr:radical SAM protein [Treponema sp.]
MFYKRKSNILFRDYVSFGYITDDRNFGYRQLVNNENVIGDRILSQSGTVFFSVLNKEPQMIDKLVAEIKKKFPNITFEVLRRDAIKFYHELEKDGFVIFGNTFQECESNDFKFSYKTIKNASNNTFASYSITNKQYTQDFFNEYFAGIPQLTSIHIEITSKCNERCVHCYIPHENKITDMPPNLFFDILNQCRNMNLLHITISGGEPMLHKDFCEFLKKCREYDFSVRILTNLTILEDKIIKELKTNSLLCIQTSLYAMNADIHDKITNVQGSFENTMKGILQLIENDIPLQISCPIMKQNKDYYADVVLWAKKNNVEVNYDPALIGKYNSTTQNLENRLTIAEVREIIENEIKNDLNQLGQLKHDVIKKETIAPNDKICSVCNSSICIAENGNVYPCIGWQSYVVGNIKEKPLKFIWENSEKLQYLRNLRNKDFPKCIKCPEKSFCTMCMVRNANENPDGNPLVVNNYFCDMARITKEIYFSHIHLL